MLWLCQDHPWIEEGESLGDPGRELGRLRCAVKTGQYSI
jgi:hypothetical protein